MVDIYTSLKEFLSTDKGRLNEINYKAMRNLLLIFTVLCLFACSDDDERSLEEQIIGKWEVTKADPGMDILPIWYKFENEGTYVSKNELSATETGKWVINENILTIRNIKYTAEVVVEINKKTMNWIYNGDINFSFKRMKE